MSFESFLQARGAGRGKWIASDGGAPIHLPGWEMRVKIGAQETQGAMALLEATMAPGHTGAAEHVHAGHDESFFVIEGSLRFRLGDTYRSVSAGETVFASRGLAHGFANIGACPARYLVALTPAGYEVYFAEVAALVLKHGAMPDRETLVRLMADHATIVAEPLE
jgi:uncharacterized cupin superfamily protein